VRLHHCWVCKCHHLSNPVVLISSHRIWQTKRPKKKFIRCVLNFSSSFLKPLTEFTWTADCGRPFQRFRTITEKKQSLASHLLYSLISFHLWLRVQLPSADLKNVCRGTVEIPRTILNSSIWSIFSSDQVWASQVNHYIQVLLSHQKTKWNDVALCLAEACLFCSGDCTLVNEYSRWGRTRLFYSRTISDTLVNRQT